MHNCAIADSMLLGKADILRYSKFGYDYAIRFRTLPVQSILPSKSKWIIFGNVCTIPLIFYLKVNGSVLF